MTASEKAHRADMELDAEGLAVYDHSSDTVPFREPLADLHLGAGWATKEDCDTCNHRVGGTFCYDHAPF